MAGNEPNINLRYLGCKSYHTLAGIGYGHILSHLKRSLVLNVQGDTIDTAILFKLHFTIQGSKLFKKSCQSLFFGGGRFLMVLVIEFGT